MKPQPHDQRLVGEMEVAKFDQDYICDDALDEVVRHDYGKGLC